MILFALGALVVGVLCGQFWFSPALSAALDPAASVFLCALVFLVGLDIGWNREIFAGLRRLGLRVLLIPLGGVMGTLLFGTLAGMALGYPANVAAGISSGFGWYSLSAVMLAESVSVQVGTVSFLVNVFREVLAIFLIPVLAKYVGPYTAISPGGATSMDTTLSFVKKYAGEEVAVASVVNGVVLSALVPILVTLFCG